MNRAYSLGLGAIALSAIALAACGEETSSPPGASIASVAPPNSKGNPFLTSRPAEQFERDLGLVISPEQNDELTRRDLCLASRAELDPVDTLPPNGRLRMTDHAAFHARFGYGVVANYLDALTVQRLRVDGVDADDDRRCANAQDKDSLLAEYFPPVEFTVRAYSLVRGVELKAAEMAEYEDWRVCMADAGYDVSVVGLDARLLVQAELDAALGTLTDPEVEYSETLPELSAEAIAKLLTDELLLWSADSRCLQQSGLGALLSTYLAEAKVQLAAEYPDLDLSTQGE